MNQGYVVTRLTWCDRVPVYYSTTLYGSAFFQAHKRATIYGTRAEAEKISDEVNAANPHRTGDAGARVHHIADLETWASI